MSDDLASFQAFLKKREAAGESYIRGDAKPLGQIVTKKSPATFFAPRGGYKEGADVVWATYEHDAGAFLPQSTGAFEILHMAASDDIAYWTGFQRAQTFMRGQDKPVSFNLRITEIFRREDGEWKMIHRHADSLAEAPKDGK